MKQTCIRELEDGIFMLLSDFLEVGVGLEVLDLLSGMGKVFG
jgi:hypothetical protein